MPKLQKFMRPYEPSELPATVEKRLTGRGNSLYVLIPHRWLVMHGAPSSLVVTMTKDHVVVTPKSSQAETAEGPATAEKQLRVIGRPGRPEKRLVPVGGSRFVLMPYRWLKMHGVPNPLVLTITKDCIVVTPKHNSPEQ